MNIVVFTGPSLNPDDVNNTLQATYLPPVAQGDVYRVARRQPLAIGIIDGYFERVPAVWHKEILWAMSQGIHVYGSASMGALRAAELALFGMRGVGWIFEAFRDGSLTDDDEVTVTHGPAELGYPAISEALVNIRRTLEHAAASGIIADRTAVLLQKLGKTLFYKQRSYPTLLTLAAEHGCASIELDVLQAWLPHHKINQKQLDAKDMLNLMATELGPGTAPKQVTYRFEHTAMWEECIRACDMAASADTTDGPAVDYRHSMTEDERWRKTRLSL